MLSFRQKRLLWRAADRLRAFLIQSAPREGRELLPRCSWDILERDARKLQMALRRRWSAPIAWFHGRYEFSLRTFLIRLDACRSEAHLASEPSTISSTGELWRDLVALHEEFPNVRYEAPEQRLSVTTEEITLEGVSLGSFQIVLSWASCTEGLTYCVEACDPHPAARGDSYTHPHVCDGELCEGDGRSAIRRALEQGRLFDFFLLVRQVLSTYNPHSAYVTLDQWSGVDCRDCGSGLIEDEVISCRRCAAELCEDCSACCTVCEQDVCSECRQRCEACEVTCCQQCLHACPECRQLLCPECVSENACGCGHEPDELPESATQPQEAQAIIV